MQQSSIIQASKKYLSVSNGVRIFLLSLLIFSIPSVVALAQTGPPASIQEFGAYLIVFLNRVLIPFLFSIALLVFIYFVVKYFIVNPDNEQDRKSAKRYALYSISAFVLMVSVWGIVNLLVGGIGLGRAEPVCPDSVPSWACRAWGSSNPRDNNILTNTFGNAYNFNNTDIGTQYPPEMGGGTGFSETSDINLTSNEDPAIIREQPESPENNCNPNNPLGPDYCGLISPEGDVRPIVPLRPESEILTSILFYETILDDTAKDFYAENSSSWYGDNFAIIASDMNILLSDPAAPSVSNTEKATAATRLRNLGYLSQGNLNDYLRSINELHYRQSLPLLEPGDLDRAARIYPARLSTEIDETKSLMEAEIYDYYRQGERLEPALAQDRTAAALESVYTGTASERYQNFENLIDNGLVVDIDNTIYDRYVDNLNTELFYQGSIPTIPN